MLKVKDTLRSTVNLTFDGRVFKAYHGPKAHERFANEVRVLRYLETRGCNFVPRLMEADKAKLRIITNNCGTRVEHIDDERVKQLFAELEKFGVRHDDPDPRNITYRAADGRFCLIDFEFATILPETPEALMTQKTPRREPKSAAQIAGLQWFGWTDIGRVRKNNEDAFLGLRFDAQEVHRLGKLGEASLAEHDFAFAVCDGMGGAKAGEYASQIAVDKLTTLLPQAFKNAARGLGADFPDVLQEVYTQVHKALAYLGWAYEECHGMQTTMSLGWFRPGWMYFGHVGDTRIYLLPANKPELKQLTEDDTHVGWLFRNGKISDYEARTHPRRNVLQKALGGENHFVEPQVGAVECSRGDTFLLCSDGMTEGLYEHQIIEVLRVRKAGFNPAKVLVDSAVLGDGRDNATALVVRVI